MPNTLNQAALKQYVARFTDTVLSDFFSGKSTISGPEILKITPLKQVNLGVISRLFDQWKADANAFRSPYFDFENEEVKKALESFMNTVSQHIAVKHADLEPLLSESVQDALVLLLAPAAYFDARLRSLPDFAFTSEQAQQLVKYTHIHSGVAKALSLRLTDSGTKFVYVNQAIRWVTDILSNEAVLDDKEPYLRQFSEVVSLDPGTLVKESHKVPMAPVPVPTPEINTERKSFFETALSENTAPPVAPSPAKPEPARVPPVKVPSAEGESLNSRYKVDMPPVAEETLYGRVQVKVESIANSIALGQRFMFVNQLFGGSTEAFEESIRELDRAANFEEARDLMSYTFASRYLWDMSSDAVADLLAIVKRRFH
ncbi:hypothetical protein GCM10027275_05280 [Rhabdobacter roseus]|uniref:Uncharacterized protein n=1 Tax=Rhabdobacter roseus TaxID=1655419 RepID=A0A840TRR9_9BACT|nr:hypothetical protein [Rhabdobacter roseus]MBB5282419.1 hypothetical protein [Rhabdobacter roseus]